MCYQIPGEKCLKQQPHYLAEVWSMILCKEAQNDKGVHVHTQ